MFSIERRTKTGKSLLWKKVVVTASPSAKPSPSNISTVLCGESSASLFTKAPFNASDITIITNGEDTNDARLPYVWVKSPYTPIPIYAPADGVLVIIRHLITTKFSHLTTISCSLIFPTHAVIILGLTTSLDHGQA